MNLAHIEYMFLAIVFALIFAALLERISAYKENLLALGEFAMFIFGAIILSHYTYIIISIVLIIVYVV